MGIFTRSKSFDALTANLTSMVADLRKLASTNQADAVTLEVEAAKINNDITNLRAEAVRADSVADKIEDLLA